MSMTPSESLRHHQLARDAIVDALVALETRHDTESLVLCAIAIVHLRESADLDHALQLIRREL